MGLKIEREEFVNKTFRLSENLVQQVQQVCAEKNISLNKFVDLALRYALENLDQD